MADRLLSVLLQGSLVDEKVLLVALLNEAIEHPTRLNKPTADTLFELIKQLIAKETYSEEDKRALLARFWAELVLPFLNKRPLDSDDTLSSLLKATAHFCVTQPQALGVHVFESSLLALRTYIRDHEVEANGLKEIRAISASLRNQTQFAKVQVIEAPVNEVVLLVSRILSILAENSSTTFSEQADALFATLLMALNCSQEAVRKPLVNQLIPQCLVWDKALGSKNRKRWLEDIWEACKQTSIRRDETLQDVFGLLCRAFDYFLGVEDQLALLVDETGKAKTAVESKEKDKEKGKGKGKGNKGGKGSKEQQGGSKDAGQAAAPSAAVDIASLKHPIVHDLRTDPTFLNLVQAGLLTLDSVSKKRCLYLLNKSIAVSKYGLVPGIPSGASALFHWEQQLAAPLETAWDRFFLLFDTLEETASHLIEPVWTYLEGMIPEKPGDYHGLSNGKAYLHPSWWVLLLRKGFSHEVDGVKKFTLKGVMTIDFDRHGAIAAEWDFIFDVLMPGIDNSVVYAAQGSNYTESSFLEYMATFFNKVLETQDAGQKGQFLRGYLKTVKEHTFGATLLVHLVRYLQEVPPLPCFGPEEIGYLSEIFSELKIRSSVVKRKLIQWYTLTALFNLLDPTTIGFRDVLMLLDSFPSDELVCTGNEQWVELGRWIKGVFEPKGMDQLILQVVKEAKDHCEIPLSDVSFLVGANEVCRFAGLLGCDGYGLLAPLVEHVSSLLLSAERDQVLQGMVFLTCMIENANVPYLEFFATHFGSRQALMAALTSFVSQSFFASAQVSLTVASSLVTVHGKVLKLIGEFSRESSAALCGDLQTTALKTLERAKSSPQRTWEELISILQSLEALHTILEITGPTGESKSLLILLFSVPLNRPVSMDQSQSQVWSSFAHHYSRLKWSSILIVLRDSLKKAPESIRAEEIIATCTAELLKTPCTEAFPIYDCVQLALGLDTSRLEVENIKELIDIAWQMCLEMSRMGRVYLQMLDLFCRLAFHRKFLVMSELNKANGILREKFRELVASGEARPGVVNFLARPLCEFWGERTNVALDNLRLFEMEFIELLLYGPIRKESATETRSTEILVANIEKQARLPASIVHDSIEKEHFVRVFALDVLLHLDATVPEQKEFGDYFFARLLSQNFEPRFSHARWFENSQDHRDKIRLWQATLVLEPFASDATVETSVGQIHTIFIQQDNLISIRMLMEWILTRMFLRCPHLIPHLFTWLGDFASRQQVVCSFVSVGFHLTQHLPKEELDRYISPITKAILPWPISHQYAPRLMSLDALLKISAQCRRDLSLPQELIECIKPLERYVDGSEEYQKHLLKFDGDYMFHDLEPRLDLSLNFIFHRFIVLAKLTDDEIIPAHAFRYHNPTPSPAVTFEREGFADWLRKAEERGRYLEQEWVRRWKNGKVIVAPDFVLAQGEVLNVQKKITPWDLLIQNDSEMTRNTFRERKRHDLIIIASLIDKLPNLGGICRTCEIFNASLLVVHDLKVRDQAMFKSLSVNAEKWVPMQEVVEAELPTYLKGLKQEGYTLLGVEQTASSKSLLNYQFPKKVVLLLGREKEGIPVDLIHVLDDCIEIPQLGVTRSLNVHVSGAILVWEYTKSVLENLS